ncbi:hypothetical protein ACHWUR_05235 [Klebsiella pneumoniae]
MFTSLFLGGPVPFKSGMKMMADFEKINWFQDFPETDGIPFAGYYWGANSSDMTLNSFDSDKPLMVSGVVENSQGFVTMSRDNYLNTQYKAPVALTVAGVMRRAAAGGALTPMPWQIFLAQQRVGMVLVSVQQLTGVFWWRARMPVRQYRPMPMLHSRNPFRWAIFLRSLRLFVRERLRLPFMTPSTGKYVSSASSVPGDIAAGDKDILIGCKTDNNNSGLATDFKSVVLINGSLTTDQHIAVQKYLLEMA